MMKTLLILLLFIPISAWGNGGSWPSPGRTVPAATSSYLYNQGFEGTGYDNGETWTTATSGTCAHDPDYTTSPLVGSQSYHRVAGSGADCDLYTGFTASGTIAADFILRVDALPATTEVFAVRNGGTTVAYLLASNTLEWYFYVGSANSGAVGSITAGHTYYIWIDYTTGTGSNAVGTLYISESDAKPGSATASITNGSSTLDASSVHLSTSGASTLTYDRVRAQ